MKKIIVAIGLVGIMASVDAMNDGGAARISSGQYEVINGALGMQRYVILKLCRVMMLSRLKPARGLVRSGGMDNLRALFGLCGETYTWKCHGFFDYARGSTVV